MQTRGGYGPESRTGGTHVTDTYSLSLYRQCGADSNFVSKGGSLSRQIGLCCENRPESVNCLR